MQQEIKKKYLELFKEFEIDEVTGCFKNISGLKFPTFPYVGSMYGTSRKILIVGLDIGSDEKAGGIQSFEERRKAIEDKPLPKHNPHIAGTYFTALFFLREILNLQTHWNQLKNASSCQKALQTSNDLPKINPLSYIALTNYYKFVSTNRKNRSGGENRVHLNQKIESDLFLEEIKIFNPNIIIFQSKSFRHRMKLLTKLTNLGISVYVGPHPAYRGKREPEHLIKQINPI